MIEIARWLVLLLIFGFAFSVIDFVTKRKTITSKLRNKDVVVVHGAGVIADAFVRQCDDALLSDDPAAFKAKRHVVLYDSSDEAIDFLSEHESDFPEDAEIIVGMDGVRRESISMKNYTFVNSADNCARLYWMKYPVRKREKICIIGYSNYAEALMTQALMVNLFALNDGVEYHLIGDFFAYRELKIGIERIATIDAPNPDGDSVFFHETDWTEERELIMSADRVIICEEPSHGVVLAGELVTQWNVNRVFVRSDSASLANALYPDSRVIVFGTTDELAHPDIILGDRINFLAYQMHIAYDINYGNESTGQTRCGGCINRMMTIAGCTKCPTFQKSWDALSPVQKYSNFASADFNERRVELVCNMLGITMDEYERLTLEELRQLLGLTAQGIEPGTSKELSEDANLAIMLNFYGIRPEYRSDERGSVRTSIGVKRALSSRDRYMLLSLEHERWNRFYYMMGYSCMETPSKEYIASLFEAREGVYRELFPDGGAFKVQREYFRTFTRTHNCLMPFDDLPDYIKIYDFNAYKQMKFDQPTAGAGRDIEHEVKPRKGK